MVVESSKRYLLTSEDLATNDGLENKYCEALTYLLEKNTNIWTNPKSLERMSPRNDGITEIETFFCNTEEWTLDILIQGEDDSCSSGAPISKSHLLIKAEKKEFDFEKSTNWKIKDKKIYKKYFSSLIKFSMMTIDVLEHMMKIAHIDEHKSLIPLYFKGIDEKSLYTEIKNVLRLVVIEDETCPINKQQNSEQFLIQGSICDMHIIPEDVEYKEFYVFEKFVDSEILNKLVPTIKTFNQKFIEALSIGIRILMVTSQLAVAFPTDLDLSPPKLNELGMKTDPEWKKNFPFIVVYYQTSQGFKHFDDSSFGRTLFDILIRCTKGKETFNKGTPKNAFIKLC